MAGCTPQTRQLPKATDATKGLNGALGMQDRALGMQDRPASAGWGQESRGRPQRVTLPLNCSRRRQDRSFWWPLGSWTTDS